MYFFIKCFQAVKRQFYRFSIYIMPKIEIGDTFMVINYGKIVDSVKMGQKIYIITEHRGIFSLIEHEKGFDITNIVIRCSSLEMIEEVIKNELKQ